MPNRILKESICTSENIDQLSAFAEITFYRLIVNCDDYGRMDGRVKVIKSRLFPLKDISEDLMLSALAELERAELVKAYVVDGKPYLQMTTWERHQQVRAKRSKYPSANESICNQLISDDSKCPRNPIQSVSKSKSLSESESRQMIDDDEAQAYQREQNRVIDAAEDAGFKMSNDVRAALIALYADFGLVKVLEGIKSCVEHGAVNLAYLRAVLRGAPKKAKPVVNAQDFGQRDYSKVDDEMMSKLANELKSLEVV